jgi:hypothetical protein
LLPLLQSQVAQGQRGKVLLHRLVGGEPQNSLTGQQAVVGTGGHLSWPIILIRSLSGRSPKWISDFERLIVERMCIFGQDRVILAERRA